MENEPNSFKRYYVEYRGIKIELTPDNTDIYLHSLVPDADHFYVRLDDEENDEVFGHYAWREKHKDNFDEMILNLVQRGCEQILKPSPSPFDIEQYRACFGRLPEGCSENGKPTGENQPEVPKNEPEIELRWISPRNEALIQKTASYIIWLAEHGKL